MFQEPIRNKNALPGTNLKAKKPQELTQQLKSKPATNLDP